MKGLKNKKIIIISVSIIIILISVISIYFIKNDKTDESAKTNNDSNNIEDSIIDNDYNVEIEPDEELENNPDEEVNEDTNENDFDEEIDIEDDFEIEEIPEEPTYSLESSNDVEYLESMIPVYYYGFGYNIYQNKLITIDKIPTDKLSINVFRELTNHQNEIVASLGEFKGEPNPEDYENETAYAKAYEKKCKESGNLYHNQMCYVKNNQEEKGYGHDAYKEELVQKIYKRFYGENYKYSAPKYIGASARGCYHQGEYYFCEEGGGYTAEGEFNYTKTLKNEEKNNQMYIYVQYLYVETKCDEDIENCVDNIYTNSDKKNKIALEKDSEYDLFDKYGSKAIRYKHTFKKNSDGTYYWYSVEPVK